ncbi:MAG: LamG domain-containing protein, partial [Planctomycetes bacterium]|nr:LamG domain-containing protein [Planctomycetota bacterium]
RSRAVCTRAAAISFEDVNGATVPTSAGQAATSFEPGRLAFDQTYYWRVDEVNNAEAVSAWEGPVWAFATVAALTVDDFEGYNNFSPDRPFQTWLDGFGYSADEFFPVGYPGNGTGAGTGHDIWSLGSPHYGGDIMETTIAKAGQSMPLYFDNTNGLTVSETQITFDAAQDWTANGVKSLSMNIHGDPDNSGQLYLKINDTRIEYHGLSDALQRQQWIPWNIDLSGVAGNLQNVTTLAIGVEGAGVTGVILVDSIRLYPLSPEMVDPVIPDDSDPNLFAYYEFEGNANDSTGLHPGTTNGDLGYTTGKVGQAMTFDRTDDYVTHDFDPEAVWSAYTVSLWSRTDTFGQVQYRSVFNNNSSNPDFQIDVDGSDPGVYRYWGIQGGEILGPVTSDWVHLAASCDGVSTSVYYNGLLVAVIDAVDTNFGRLAIGTNRGTNQPFAGSIDDVRVYDRALSIAEVAGLAGLTEPIPVSF